MNDQPLAPVVDRRDDRGHYAILVGGEQAGLTAFADRGDQRVFYHTEIGDQFARLGLAKQLVAEALSDTRAHHKRIVAVCPYVAKFLKQTDEYTAATDPVTPDILQWLGHRLP
ncbi:GNAT family N-acetyltransferase [Streptomyces sp. NPDC101181]|uniref:GNAT family N-acetyltransferase n=1 Tax=Streptomyces sp. NPDC101181 TaxID=3366125 RepID=UPI003803052D